MTGRADYYERQEARKERLEDRAEKLQREGEARAKRGWDNLHQIPFGQPILVGHYSEKRDRNYRNRACNNIDKGYELQKHAGELAARAENMGSGGISSDNPDAVELLREKLANLEAKQAQMVAANKLVRKKDREGLAALMGSEAIADELLKPDFCGRFGFASYQLTNNSGNMRRIKERIADLERNEGREPKEVLHNSGVRMVENPDVNRVQLFFPGKPDSETRTKLKQAGFRWSPMEGAWQRQLNNRAVWVAGEILKELVGEPT